MAKVTITVTDIDLSNNTYKVDFAAEGSQIEAGQATAAYFTGYYLHSLVAEDFFINDVAAFGRTVVENMKSESDESFPHPVDPATVALILEDKDLNTGRYQPRLEFGGGDKAGEHLPTAAQVIALYMRNILNSVEFQKACWAFAEDMIRENDMARITNAEFGPAENDDTPATNVA